MYKMSLEHLVVPESKEVLSKTNKGMSEAPVQQLQMAKAGII